MKFHWEQRRNSTKKLVAKQKSEQLQISQQQHLELEVNRAKALKLRK